MPFESEPSFTVTRVLPVEPAAVWRAWTDSELVKRWWGPQGFTGTIAEMDFREGGSTLVAMRGPEGPDMYNTWTYSRIEEPHRIEFMSRFADSEGREIAPEAVGLPPGIPAAVPHVVIFTSLGDQETEMVVMEYGYAPGPMLEMSKQGQEQVLDKMTALFES